jgi:cephalosporin hydroxylase
VYGTIRQRAQRKTEDRLARAFSALVDRQAAEGRFTPEVRAAMRKAARRVERRRAARQKDQPLTPAAEKRIAADLQRMAMVADGHPRSSPAVRAVIDAFHRLYYHDVNTWRQTSWQGITTWKCPLDLWMYQDIVHRLRPGLIVETGTAYGGSANYLGFLCDLVGSGQIVSVDIEPKVDELPEHPRVTFIRGSSTDPEIVAKVHAMAVPGEPVVVILDSDHSARHVRDELKAYADLVTPGSYLIVEDTNVNGHPVYPNYGPGPMEALDEFLAMRDDFVIDYSMQRYHMTLNPRGYLRRKDSAD